MNAERPPAPLWSQSRELALSVCPSGRIVSADDRAAALLGLRPGADLFDSVLPQQVGKARRMLSEARAQPSVAWELTFLIEDTTVVARLFSQHSGERGADAPVWLLGSVAPQDLLDAWSSQRETMDEIIQLNRDLARQRTTAERLASELTDADAGARALHVELKQRLAASNTAVSSRLRLFEEVGEELRTPIHSVLGLTQLLLSECDGPLTGEQRRQLGYVHRSAQDLARLVSDLLDLSMVEAADSQVDTSSFNTDDLLSELRGALRPLLPEDGLVALHVPDPSDPIALETDRAKLGQIMRELVSNAIHHGGPGEIRLSVSRHEHEVTLTVHDEGAGVDPAEQRAIFDAFVRRPDHSGALGAGLGLPVARGLARLLGGELTLQDVHGQGASFAVTVPRIHPDARERHDQQRRTDRVAASEGPRAPILIIEDKHHTSLVYERYLTDAGFAVMVASSLSQARSLLRRRLPCAVVVDIVLEEEACWTFLQELRQDPRTANLPVLVVTVTGDAECARALGADEFWLRPLDPERVVQRVTAAATGAGRVLVIDDDRDHLAVLRPAVEGAGHVLLASPKAEAGVRMAREHRPHLILLDLLLRDGGAFDVIDALKSDPATRHTPLVLTSAPELTAEQRRRLAGRVEVVLSKTHLSKELAIHRIRDALRSAGVRHAVKSPPESNADPGDEG